MAGKVTVCYTGNEVPDVVRKSFDFTEDIELKELIELAYSYGVKCSEIERIFGYKAGAISYACDLGKINLVYLYPRNRTKGLNLLKNWKKKCIIIHM